MKRRNYIRLAGVALVAVAISTGTASAHLPKTITIRHQMRGCHAWSFANGAYKASLRVRVDRDTELVFLNIDMMPHRLIQVSGPTTTIMKPNMNHMSAQAFVSFRRAGTYKFKTRAGEDYMKGAMRTIGPDNVLRLTVVVT